MLAHHILPMAAVVLAPGMINDLLDQFPVDVGRSILVGDKLTDLRPHGQQG